KKLPELQEIAKELDVPKYRTQKKLDLVYQILDYQAANPKAVKAVLKAEEPKPEIKEPENANSTPTQERPKPNPKPHPQGSDNRIKKPQPQKQQPPRKNENPVVKPGDDKRTAQDKNIAEKKPQ